ncbi:MAG TPA: FHA domain-containing protein, partial [Phototrophicaceae bacterium]|nr:FHA domain-containing protein [Phototrophicaceae bacterium]
AFYFIESPEVTPTIFQEELQGLLSVVGQNLVISIDQTEYIADVKQLNAYPTERTGRRLSFRLGDVFGDEIKALLLELSIPAMKEMGQRQIGILRFEYDELDEKGSQHQVWEMPVMVNVSQSLSINPPAVNREVKRSVLLLQAAQARRQAVEAADKGKFIEAAKFLRDAVTGITEAGFNDDQLEEESKALTKQAEELERGATAYDEYSRKSMSTQAFYTMSSRHEDTVVLRMREQQREKQVQETSEEPKVGQAGDSTPRPDIPTPISGEPGKIPAFIRWQGRVFPLKGDLIKIGRSNENDIIIPVKGVSRFHAELKRENGQLLLEDKNSTNGTTINGIQISGQYIIRAGDEVLLCDEKLMFLETE